MDKMKFIKCLKKIQEYETTCSSYSNIFEYDDDLCEYVDTYIDSDGDIYFNFYIDDIDYYELYDGEYNINPYYLEYEFIEFIRINNLNSYYGKGNGHGLDILLADCARSELFSLFSIYMKEHEYNKKYNNDINDIFMYSLSRPFSLIYSENDILSDNLLHFYDLVRKFFSSDYYKKECEKVEDSLNFTAELVDFDGNMLAKYDLTDEDLKIEVVEDVSKGILKVFIDKYMFEMYLK